MKQQPDEFSVALKVSLTYAVVAALWILFSDRMASLFSADMAELVVINTFKGWAFVVVTALLLYLQLRFFYPAHYFGPAELIDGASGAGSRLRGTCRDRRGTPSAIRHAGRTGGRRKRQRAKVPLLV